mgnify:CR=1 FL=1|nr:MAG TPA: tail component [Caudoviricetes sp.]
MTEQELYELLGKTGFPVAYHHFKTTTPPPFVVYIRINDDNVAADNKVYVKHDNYQVELYTATKDVSAEKKLEAILDENELVYSIDELYIEAEEMYEVIYTIQI